MTGAQAPYPAGGHTNTLTQMERNMQTNFKLIVHPNSDNLHIKLMGDFDTPAAELLMKSLQKHHRHFRKIFIHTSCLNTIETAGAMAFQRSYNLPDEGLSDIVFTGEYAAHIAPYAWQVL
jgi:hypothetical protein